MIRERDLLAHAPPQRTRRGLRAAALARTGALAVALLVFGAIGAHAQPPTNVFVEIDYMQDGTHSHRPTLAEVIAVVEMFACHGITLSIQIDDALPEVTVIPDGPAANDFFTWVGTNSFRSFRNSFFDNAEAGWHYCIFGHQYDPSDTSSATCSSGLGEQGGDDFIVTLGCANAQVGTSFDRAATFAHELGHNLELDHFAGGNSLAGTFSPNYASIMSYQYQLTGVRNQMQCLDLIDTTAPLKNLDYSNGRMPGIWEAALDEGIGLGVRRIDWNCDGSTGGIVAQDLNGQSWCGMSGALTTIDDQNDWALLVDNAATGDLPPSRYTPCASPEEFAPMKMSPTSCTNGQPALAPEACAGGLMIWLRSSYGGPEDGTGPRPFNTFLEGYNPAPNGSALYLQPGSYNLGGAFLALNKPITIAGPGGATITR